jgi:hypothetical protein
MHRNEIYSKLIAIMRERLEYNLRQLPALADTWAAPSAGIVSRRPRMEPSNFALANAKQLRTLHQVQW